MPEIPDFSTTIKSVNSQVSIELTCANGAVYTSELLEVYLIEVLKIIQAVLARMHPVPEPNDEPRDDEVVDLG